MYKFRPNLRLGICKRHDQRAVGHALHLLGLENARRRQPQEYICAVDHVIEDTSVAIDRIPLLVRIHAATALMNDAVDVAEGHVFLAQAHSDQQVDASQGGCAGAADDETHFLDTLFDQA